MSDWFCVTVEDCSGQIVTIESGCLSGREIGKREEQAIRSAIDHLSGFIAAAPPTDELARLEREIATESAIALLESEFLWRGDGWLDSLFFESTDSAAEIRYLELRGLLERHPENPDWVRVKDNSPAINEEGEEITCAECGRTIVLPYTDDEKTAVIIEQIDDWTSPPIRCPKCSKEAEG